MEQINGSMSGAHCQGMAVLSLLMHTGQISPDSFGSAPVAAGLAIGDEKLQREIAYWWATQVVQPTQTGVISGTPNDILEVSISTRLPQQACPFCSNSGSARVSNGLSAEENHADQMVAYRAFSSNHFRLESPYRSCQFPSTRPELVSKCKPLSSRRCLHPSHIS